MSEHGFELTIIGSEFYALHHSATAPSNIIMKLFWYRFNSTDRKATILRNTLFLFSFDDIERITTTRHNFCIGIFRLENNLTTNRNFRFIM